MGIARIARGDVAGLDQLDIDALVLPLFAVRAQPLSVAGFADWRLAGRIGRLVKSGKFTGAVDEALLMPAMGRFGAERIFLLGLGDPGEQDRSKLRQVMTRLAKVLGEAGAKRVAVAAPVLPTEGPGSAPRSREREASSRGEVAMSLPAQRLYVWMEAVGGCGQTFEEMLLLDPDGSLASAELHLADVARRSGFTWQV